ncbi:MAG TPA: 1,4-alpha-glucan branching protein domain-containing protein [Solirubrobacteraceae bacterium]|jgi:1,4-alpha-glucan branching enzyme|nr:1,4-alpha-glucan branching protein domain-containing protein [Solirubrobacteraceae bacterium]
MSARRDGGALAIVLHTHMPYVEGFGTWPFGEEWLWEAMACCYLPLVELLDRGAPLTVSLTPVLCDQLEAPDLARRFGAFVQGVRRGTHEQDAAGLRAAGEEQLARELERSWRDYAGALESLDARGGDLLGAFASHAQWTSAATHAVLPLLATDEGVRIQLQCGIDSFRERFAARWRGGFWLPECAYAPWLGPMLEHCGAHATCVELTRRFGEGSPEHLHPFADDSGIVLVPIDRATISLVWSDHGYPASGRYRDYHHHTVHHHNPWNNAGGAYDAGAAQALAREHAQDFVARTLARLAQAATEPPAGVRPGTPALVVCALDTELLGHWWYEGVGWLSAVVEECSRQGLELVRLDDALAQIEPRPLRQAAEGAAYTWGAGGDLSTWSGPAVAEMAFATRAAELEVLRGGRPTNPAAVRELLALQASDWAFMVSRGLAVPYARERFATHLGGVHDALASGSGADAAHLRNLAGRGCVAATRAA